jgi:hypothetical protein
MIAIDNQELDQAGWFQIVESKVYLVFQSTSSTTH